MSHTTKIRTVCDPNCHANPRCGIVAHVKRGRIIDIEPGSFPWPEFEKRICLMGQSRLEYQYHPDRLLFPLQRTGKRGEGHWKRITWDQAYQEIARRFSEIANTIDRRSIAIIAGTGMNGVLTRGASYRFAAGIGATAARAGAVDYGVPKGLEYMFGVRASTYFGPGGHEFADSSNSKVILFWGGNDADTRFVDFPFVRAARRAGTNIICIDPNRSTTASQADLWISLRPGTDGALALAMLNEIFSRDFHDSVFLRAHTNAPYLIRADTGAFLRERDLNGEDSDSYVVWSETTNQPSTFQNTDASLNGQYEVELVNGSQTTCLPAFAMLRKLAAQYPLDRAARITTVPAEQIRYLAHHFATHKPAAIRIGFGIDRWYWSDLTARAIAMLSVVTGNIGVAGSGVSVHSGSYALPTSLQKFRRLQGERAALLDPIGLMNAIEKGAPYPVKALWLSGSNLLNQTAPNRNRVLSDILPKLDFLVVSDHFMTASADLADIVLPAATIFERLDIVPGIFLQLQQPAVDPEGESRSEFDIFKGLASRMGHPTLFGKQQEDYLAEALDTDDPMFEGITLDLLKRDGVAALNRLRTPYVAFRDYRFNTPSGRIEIYKEELLLHGVELPFYHEPIEASYTNSLIVRFPLTLLFSHSPYRIHSTFANMPLLKNFEPEPLIDMHPLDADARDIEDGAIVRVFNDRGSVSVRCHLNPDIRQGVLVLPEGHWVKDFVAGDPYGLTHELVSPTSENYAFYDTLVEVEPT